MAGACASTGARADGRFPVPPHVSAASRQSDRASRSRWALPIARWHGAGAARDALPERRGRSRGFDCSGFTQYVFAQSRHRAAARGPRSVRAGHAGEAAGVCTRRPVFFTTIGRGASHVGHRRRRRLSSCTRRARRAWSASSASARATGRRAFSARAESTRSLTCRRPLDAQAALNRPCAAAARRLAQELAHVQVVLGVACRLLSEAHRLDLDAGRVRFARRAASASRSM